MNNEIQYRNLDTDIMRIVAAFFVIVIHVAASHSYSFCSVFYNSIARFSVPVFIIISGRYMLAKKQDWHKVALKCCKLFAIMIIWAGIYYLYDIFTGAHTYSSIGALVSYLLSEPTHLWYIYATIALYIFTPIIYTFCSHASKADMIYALILTFFFGSIITIIMRTSHFAIISTIIDKMKFDCTLGFVFCYLLGNYWQKYKSPKIIRVAIYILGILGTAATIVGTLILSRSGTTVNYLLFSFFAPNVLVASAAFYLFIKRISGAHDLHYVTIRAFIHRLASCTLGIYLLHVLILQILIKHIFGNFDVTAGISIPLEALCVFILSAICIFVLKEIPFIKKLV